MKMKWWEAMSLARRGVVANVAHLGVVAGSQVVQIPILIHAFGSPGYARWLVISAIPAYLTLADMGLATAGSTEVTRLWATGRRAEAVQLLRSYLGWLQSAAAVGLLLIATVALLIVDSLPQEVSSDPNSPWVILLLLGWVYLTLLYGAREGAFRMVGRFPLGIWFLVLGRLGDLVILGFVALTTRSLVFSAAGLFVFRAAALVLLSRRMKLLMGAPEPDLAGTFREHAVRSLITPSIGALTIPIAQAVGAQGLILVAGGVLSASGLIVLNAVRLVSGLLRQTSLTIGYGVMAEMTRSHAQGDEGHARRLQRRAEQLSFALSVAACLTLIIIGPPLISAWTRQPPPSRLVVAAFVVSPVIDCFWLGSLVEATARNKQMLIGTVGLIMTSASLLVGWVMAQSLGVLGFGLATCLSSVVMVGFVRLSKI